MNRLICGAAVLLVAAGAVRADDSVLTEADWLQELPSVLAGSRLAQTIVDAPVAISVIDRQMIEAAGVREIQELLRLVPGMLVHHDNGHHATVTYHALADTHSRRMLVLIDGRPAYSPVISHVNWTMLPLALEDIERIEVIRGANAAAFGANALLGVISITTRKPHLVSGLTTHATAGNNGIRRALAQWGSGGEAIDWRVTAQFSGDDGYDGPVLDDDEKDTALLSARADWRDAAGGAWELHAGFADGRRAHGGQNNILRPPHTIDSTNAHAQARWTSGRDPDDIHSVNMYWTLDSWDQVYSTLPVAALGGARALWDLSVRGERAEIEFQRTLNQGDNVRSAWGVAVRLDRMNAPGLLGRPDTQRKHLYRAFTHHELRLAPNWVANLGLMLENDSTAGAELSPRAALNWSFAPGQVVRASISEATRTPTIIEESADQSLEFGPFVNQVLLASGGLRSERVRSREIGWMLGDVNRELTLDARVFYDEIDRLITYHFVPFDDLEGGFLDFRNRDELRKQGFEFQLTWRPSPSTRVIGNYAYIDIEATDIDELYSKSGPRQVASAFAERRFGTDTLGSILWYRIGEMQGMNTGHLIRRHERVDLKLSRDFVVGHTRGRLSFTLQEPLGDLRDFRVRNEFHRRWFIDLRLDF